LGAFLHGFTHIGQAELRKVSSTGYLNPTPKPKSKN
jgi:hypothetical protein